MRRDCRLVLVLGAGLRILAAQECPPAANLLFAATLNGALNETACQLTDGSPYVAYRMQLPVRGAVSLDLTGTASELQLIVRSDTGVRLASGTSLKVALEAGSYQLLVNGKTPSDAGAYTVSSSFTSEPAIFCDGFAAIGRRQTVSGNLGSYGCSAPDGSPYDGWSLTTFGPGTLTVSASAADFAPLLTLRGSDGRALATSASGTLVAPLLGDSQYLLVVASPDKTGTYQVTTSFQNAPDDSCRATLALSASTTDAGTISTASCRNTIPGSADQLYYNYYNLTVADSGTATMGVTSGDFAPALYLLDEAGNTLAFDSVGGGYDSSGRPRSNIRIPLRPGNYVLQVVSDAASGGDYTLEYDWQAGATTPCSTLALAPDDVKHSVLNAGSCRTSFGLTDLYSLTMPVAGMLDLDLASLSFPPTLLIRDTKDNTITFSGEADGASAHITAWLPAGSYIVATSARSLSGAYDLTAKLTPQDASPCSFARGIPLNGYWVQRLNQASCKGADGQPVDYYSFTLAADSLALGVVTSSEVDGYLSLLDSGGNVLRTDDNSYAGIDPLIVQYLPAGSYKFAVRSATASPGGLYQVDMRTVEGPRPALCTAKADLTPGTPVTGNITYTGCQYPYQNHAFADLYRLVLASDAMVDLGLSSSDFDAYLVLLDAKGNVVDYDDDSGGNTNSRLVDPLPSGTYYVVARPYGNYLSGGAYTITAKLTDSSTLSNHP